LYDGKGERSVIMKKLTKIDLAVIVLSAPNNRLQTLMPLVPKIREVIKSIQTGEIIYV
jgi:hypothetical protein